MKYIPILKYNEKVDVSAYNKLEYSTKESIVPLIEVFQQNKVELSKLSFTNRKFFLNLEFLHNFKESVDTFEKLHLLFPDMIPVINSSHFDVLSKRDIILSMKKLMSIGFREYAVKLNSIASLEIPDNLETILLMLNTFDNITFFIDIDYAYKITNTDLMLEYFSDTIDHMLAMIDESIKKIVICGSLLTVTSNCFTSYEDEDFNAGCIVENNLLQTYLLLRKKYTNLDLYYSDYTIDEKNKFTDENTPVYGFYPMVKYTLKNGDIMVYKSNCIREFKKYPEIANEIFNSNEYLGEDHCCGCQYIKDTIDENIGGKNTGSPASWKTNMMTHHMSVMANLLK